MRRYVLLLLLWVTPAFAPPHRRVETSIFAATINELRPDIDYRRPIDRFMELEHEEQLELAEKERRQDEDAWRLTDALMRKTPDFMPGLADRYPAETVRLLEAVSQHQPPMSLYLNALLLVSGDDDVRLAAAKALARTHPEDPHHREVFFRHVNDPDPFVRAALAPNLTNRIQGPFTPKENQGLIDFELVATEEHDHEMVTLARAAIYAAVCDKIFSQPLDFLTK